MIEERLIAAYLKDVESMLKDFIGSGLDIQSQKCNKCEFTTHSEGLFRKHKVMIHDYKGN